MKSDNRSRTIDICMYLAVSAIVVFFIFRFAWCVHKVPDNQILEADIVGQAILNRDPETLYQHIPEFGYGIDPFNFASAGKSPLDLDACEIIDSTMTYEINIGKYSLDDKYVYTTIAFTFKDYPTPDEEDATPFDIDDFRYNVEKLEDYDTVTVVLTYKVGFWGDLSCVKWYMKPSGHGYMLYDHYDKDFDHIKDIYVPPRGYVST